MDDFFEAQLQFQDWSDKLVENFLAYVDKHFSRLRDYCQYLPDRNLYWFRSRL